MGSFIYIFQAFQSLYLNRSEVSETWDQKYLIQNSHYKDRQQNSYMMTVQITTNNNQSKDKE